MNIIVLGSTSNICAIRVFNNLNNITEKINKIYCYGMEKWNTDDFLNDHFFKKVKINSHDTISKKIIFLSGTYDYDNYKKILSRDIITNAIIYVSTPPICYNDILNYFNNDNSHNKLLLEKPLSLNYKEFLYIKPFLTKKTNVIDHFLYKQDIINIIELYKNKTFQNFKIQFNYTDDVEDRLGYFDKVGFFIDMFQSHFLSIVYSLINIELYDFLNMNIIKNIRKQYIDYGGKNNKDTYFYVEIKVNNTTYIFEAGKAMLKSEKKITIDGYEFVINNYENEYEIYFNNIINDSITVNLVEQQEIFWNITELLQKKNNTLEYYSKNALSSMPQETKLYAYS